MKLRIWMGLVLLACMWVANATGPAGVRKTVENSMLLTGSIHIEQDGSVSAYALDQPEKLPEVVRQFVAKAAPLLSFEPVLVDGKPVKARVKMGLRVVATKKEDGNYSLRIGGASFGEPEAEANALVSKKMTPPRYPEAAYMANITGTVYLLVKIGAQGNVQDVATEQTNLTVLGNSQQMEQGRKLLSKVSLAAARRWEFSSPTRAALGKHGYMVVRVPVDFRFEDQAPAGYGEWQAYVPGPREQRPAWLDTEGAKASPDALVAGGIYPVGSGPKLRTPLPSG